MKRDRLEIIRSILTICNNGAKKTEIVYKANLNFRSAEGHLQWLADRELIAKEGKSFRTSSKGAKLVSDLQGTFAILELNSDLAL